ncbi:unnamed protein product [Pleuronectes platessa]|uniref:Uncharacterized protein n=1 Tax=Pleuronectes platessa TaxID=8262 RepID=A0A9N7Z2Y3_PLEPL|nr:unnamed protein product [Pleuronectes platessa]
MRTEKSISPLSAATRHHANGLLKFCTGPRALQNTETENIHKVLTALVCLSLALGARERTSCGETVWDGVNVERCLERDGRAWSGGQRSHKWPSVPSSSTCLAASLLFITQQQNSS